MTKRELNYLLYQNPKRAFRLIEPKSHFRVGTKYLYAKIGRNNEKIRKREFEQFMAIEMDYILNGDGKSKAKQIINNTL